MALNLFESAVCFATERHNGQKRKMENSPYILHPLEVASIVGTMTDDQEVLAAAVLHDTVEDTKTTMDEIKEKFGKRVALLVMMETEEKRENQPPESTWELRKEETLLILKNTKDIAVKMMWLGDKLSNMRSFARLYRRCGDSLWLGFHQKDPKKQLWYYEKIKEYLAELAGYDAYREYCEHVEYVFQNQIGEKKNGN